MKKLNATQYQRLRKYDRQLTTSHHANYITGCTKTMGAEIVEIYNYMFETNEKKTNCPTCLLKYCKKIAPYYFEIKEEREKKNKEKKEGEQNGESN